VFASLFPDHKGYIRCSTMYFCRSCREATLLIFLLLAVAVPSWCQSGDQGSIAGVAFDASGAVIVDGHLKVHNLTTSFSASTNTNEYGLFRFAVLPVGFYELTADHAGFATIQIKNIDLTVGANLTFTLRFNLAGSKEAMTITEEAPILERSRSQLSTTVDNRFIDSLPVNGRDFTAFTLLTPGVTMDARGGLSFAGQRAMNSLLLDGINFDDPFWGQQMSGFILDGRQPYPISQDAVREFQVNSNAYSAEFGRAGGGVINTVTRSGTNDFHGTAFWFYRDQSMNANDPVNKRYGLPKSPFHFNQFGAILGGPIRRDHLFFVLNYEGLRSNIPNAVFLNLPTDFQLSPAPTIAGFQQIALDYLKPRAASWVWPVAQNDYLGKLDWRLSQRHRLTALWDMQRFSGGGALDVDPQNAFEHTVSNPSTADTGTISLTSELSHNTVNVLRFGYLREGGGFGPVGINPEANIYENGQRVLTVGRRAGSPQESPVHQFQWSDTLHHDHGLHALKMGADILVARIRFFFAQSFSGSYDFGSLESFGRNLSGQPQPLPVDDYLQAFSGFGEHGVVTHPNFTSIAGFVEDTWRIRPSLTLNLGVRYDLQIIDKPSTKNPSQALLAAGLDTSVLPTDKNNFAPRVGMAWSPTPSSRLVLRAGYGIFYALTPSVLTSRADFQNGITTQTRTFPGNSPLASLIPVYPNTFCGPPDASGLPPNCAPPNAGASLPTLQLFSAHYRQPYVQQASLGMEVQARKDLSVSASYILSKGTRLQQVRDVNLGSTMSGTISIANTNTLLSYRAFQVQRPIPDFYRILVFNSDASSIYHGLAVQLNRRFSQNFHALASYTLSKVIDNNPNVYALSPGPYAFDLVQDPTDPRSDRGPGSNDQRHRFTLAALWTPNYGNRFPKVARTILQGWEVSGILTAQSGQPYSGLINFDLNNDGVFATDRRPGLGRNTFYMPASVSLDPRLTRNINIGEQAKLQIIWEAFNVLNHANITYVNNIQYTVSGFRSDCGIAPAPCLVPQNQALSGFGSPFFSSGPRIMQLAMKFTF
jgi:hypothetical protein